MGKGITNLYRYVTVSKSANERYIKALSSANDTTEVIAELEKICNPTKNKKSSYRGLNPLSKEMSEIFTAILHGRNLINGFSNKNIRELIYPKSRKENQTSFSMMVTRLFARLRAFGLIKKIRSSFRYLVTDRGFQIMSAALRLKKIDYIKYMTSVA